MITKASKAYQDISVQTSVSEAGSVDLILLVYGRLLQELKLVMRGLEANEDDGQAASKALELIEKGLLVAIDFEKGGEVATNLATLYDWAIREILTARLRKDPAKIAAVIEVFQNLESGWVAIKDNS